MLLDRPHDSRQRRCGDGNRARAAAVGCYSARSSCNTRTAGPKQSSAKACPSGLRTSDGGGRLIKRRRQAPPAHASRGIRSKCCGAYPNKIKGRPAPCWWPHSKYWPELPRIANRVLSSLGRSPAGVARDTRNASR
jgi:hypothetical protein